MHQEAKKGMLLTLGAIGLVGLGAIAAVLLLKFTATPAPKPADPAPVVAAAPVPEVPATPMAQVTSVQPHYTIQSYPTRVCHHVPHTVLVGAPPGAHSGSTGLGAVVGGIAGGALGNQVGQGRGRTAATIGGVVLGALAGNSVEGNMNQPPPPQAETVVSKVCHTQYIHKSVVSGYDVGYVYNGQPGTTHMTYAPVVGSTIPLTLQPG